jgi:hypothetical protein
MNLGSHDDYILDRRHTKDHGTHGRFHIIAGFYIAFSVLIDLFSRRDFSDCRRQNQNVKHIFKKVVLKNVMKSKPFFNF